MLGYSDITLDQTQAIDHIYEEDHTLLIAVMGGGKTVIGLTAVSELQKEKIVTKTLVLAPLTVCLTVWSGEHDKWSHLKHLRVGVACGPVKARQKVFDDISKYDIVAVNFESLPWLKAEGLFKHFDSLIVDESTKLKTSGSWFKSIRPSIKKFNWRLIMSGTPVSENWQEVFYQMMLADNGAALGRNKERFMREYFYTTDYSGYNWKLVPGSEEKIAQKVASEIYVLPDYRDSLPELTIKTVFVDMPESARIVYRDMAKGMQAEGVTAETAAVQQQKLEQIAAGFMYSEDPEKGRSVLQVHDEKVSEVQKLVKMLGRVVIVYRFQEELDRLRQAYPELISLSGLNAVKTRDAVAAWNSGGIPVLAVHPQSGGHGLNLAEGGCAMIFTGPIWSRDRFDQTIGRLWRRGQDMPVDVFVIESAVSVDQLVSRRVAGKADNLSSFLEHIEQVVAEG